MVLKVAKSSVTDNKRKPKTPQIEITNNGNADKYVNGIEMTFDSYFSVKGIVEIVIGDKVILDGNDAEDFRQYKLLTVPVNSEILKREKSIKIYVWNTTDDDIVKLTANIALDESAGNSDLSGIPTDPDVINRDVSGGSVLSTDAQAIVNAVGGNPNQASRGVVFNHQIYRDRTLTELIDMAGNKNMIVTISSSSSFGGIVVVGTSALVDGDTATSLSVGGFPASETEVAKIDFGSLASRVPSAQYSKSVSGNSRENTTSGTVKLQVSDDDVNWITVSSQTEGGFSTVDRTITGTQQQFRYMRITLVRTFDGFNEPRISIKEMYDDLFFGGIAYLSFEIMDADGLWQTLDGMSSSDIGTISAGTSIIRTFGAVTGLFIPSSQSLFRAKLHVDGSVNMGVSMIRGQ